MPKKLQKISRDLFLLFARGALGTWGVFERPYSFTYPIFREAERWLEEKGYERKEIRKVIARWQSRQVIATRRGKGGMLLVLTRKGKENVARHLLTTLKIKRQRKWDGMWRLVAFDIPEKSANARQSFRRALSRLGLVQVQRSLWASPFPCEREVIFLSAVFRVKPHVTVFETQAMREGKALKQKFNLS